MRRSDLLKINDYASRVSHLFKYDYTSVRYRTSIMTNCTPLTIFTMTQLRKS